MIVLAYLCKQYVPYGFLCLMAGKSCHLDGRKVMSSGWQESHVIWTMLNMYNTCMEATCMLAKSVVCAIAFHLRVFHCEATPIGQLELMNKFIPNQAHNFSW